jgi:predicted enzyme related to lactoylglutathione lyase
MAGRLMELLLRVNDVKRSVEFYRDTLGLAVGPGDETESHFEASWGRWEAGSADLLLFLIYPADADHPRSVCEIGFSVEDLDAAHAAVVRAGLPVIEAPSPKPWGLQATYADPDGNIVVVAQVPRS